MAARAAPRGRPASTKLARCRREDRWRDEAISTGRTLRDCFAALAMTPIGMTVVGRYRLVFILWLIIIFLLLSGSGFYGYRRSYYGAGGAIGLLILLFVLFWLAAAFAGPYWGWYGWWW